MRPIGYYVHHHGEGHRQRAFAIGGVAPTRFMMLGSSLAERSGDIATVTLPDDRIIADGAFDGDDHESNRYLGLHYAPLGHDGVRARMAAIAQWIGAAQPALIVVDVSVEVAMLARLCATSVAYVRLGGRRDDAPHLEAYRAASILVAPFAEALDDEHVPHWIKRKTFYAPGIVPRRVQSLPSPGLVLVVFGRGGSSLSDSYLSEAARRTPNHQWRVIGLASKRTDLPNNIVFAGWIDDPASDIARAEIVVGAAGDGLVGAVLAARRPFVCIPDPRPFDEQLAKAAALRRTNAAIVLDRWPDAAGWNDILASAKTIEPSAQASLDDPDGASRLAHMLMGLADRQK